MLITAGKGEYQTIRVSPMPILYWLANRRLNFIDLAFDVGAAIAAIHYGAWASAALILIVGLLVSCGAEELADVLKKTRPRT